MRNVRFSGLYQLETYQMQLKPGLPANRRYVPGLTTVVEGPAIQAAADRKHPLRWISAGLVHLINESKSISSSGSVPSEYSASGFVEEVSSGDSKNAKVFTHNGKVYLARNDRQGEHLDQLNRAYALAGEDYRAQSRDADVRPDDFKRLTDAYVGEFLASNRKIPTHVRTLIDDEPAYVFSTEDGDSFRMQTNFRTL